MEINTRVYNRQPEQSQTESEPTIDSADPMIQQEIGERLKNEAALKTNEAILEVMDQGLETADQKSDSVEISDKNRTSHDSDEEAGLRLEEMKRLLEEIQRLLENWQPKPGWGLVQDINQLKNIYQKLFQDIFKLYIHQEQAGAQVERINALLLAAVDRLGQNKFPDLLHLFETYGEKESADLLRTSVLRKIMGRPVTVQEVASVRKQGNLSQPTDHSSRTDQGYGTGRTVRENGLLYFKAKGNHVNTDQHYKESVQAVERFRVQFGDGEKGIKQENRFFGFQNQYYTVSDIERTERFLNYITNQGNLYSNPALTAKNEELLGFLMAESMVKVQVYSEHASVGRKISVDVWNALQRFFRQCLVKSMESSPPYGGEVIRRPDSKLIRRIYSQVMELVQGSKTPGKGLEKGLRHVCELFLSRKERNETAQKQTAQGFFSGRPEERDKIGELRYGAEVLDQDWKEFLKSIGQNNNELLQMMLSNCPWGLMIDGSEGQKESEISGPPLFIFIAAAVLCLLIVGAAIILIGL